MPERDVYILYGGLFNKPEVIYLYSSRSFKWSEQQTKGKIPQLTRFHWAWYEEPHFFVMGGETEKKKINDIYWLNFETLMWRKLFVFEPPLPRYQHAISKVEKENTIILFGGCAQQLMNDLWELDLSSWNYKGKSDIPGAVWSCLSQKGDIPTVRRGHKLVKFPALNKLVLYGGYTVQNNDLLSNHDPNIYVLDIKSLIWSKLKLEGDLPKPKALHSMNFFSINKLIIIGGILAEPKDEEEKEWETFMVDFKINKISKPFIANTSPSSRYGHSCASNDNPKEPQLLWLGGMDITDTNARTYWSMEPFRLLYHDVEEETKFQKHSEGAKLVEEVKGSIKVSNKKILENNKLLNELENEVISISAKNAKKNRQVNKLVSEIDELGTKKLNMVKSLESK